MRKEFKIHLYKIYLFIKYYFISIFIFIGLFSLTLYMFFESKDRVEKRIKGLFEYRAQQANALIKRRIVNYIQILKGAKGVFAAAEEVDREEWKDYFNIINVLENYPGIQGIGFAEYIDSKEELKEHLKEVRSHGYSDYSVRPAGIRKIYTPIKFLEPFTGRNIRAFGFDMYSEPVRRKAMETARDNDIPAISGKVKLVQETNQDVQAGFLIYLPIYEKEISPKTVKERRKFIKGFVYSPFRANDLITSILGKEYKDLNIIIYDGKEVNDKNLLFHSSNTIFYPNSNIYKYNKISNINIGGHVWTLKITATSTFGSFAEKNQPYLILTIGSIVSLMLFFVVGFLSKIRKSNNVIQTITNNATAALFMLDTKGYCTFLNPAAESLTGYTFEEFKNKTLHNLIHNKHPDGSDYPMSDCILVKAITSLKEIKAHEDVFINKNGDFFNVICAARPVFEYGFPVSTVLEVRDITAEKKAKESLMMQAKVLDSMKEGVCLIDENGFLIFTNPAEDEMFGYERGELVGKHFTIQNLLNKEENAIILSYVIQQVNEEGFWFGEFDNIKKDGIPFVTKAHITSLSIDKKNYWVIVQEDITSEKEYKQAIINQNRTLEILNTIGKTISAELVLEKVVQAVIDATTQLSEAEMGLFITPLVTEHFKESYLFFESKFSQKLFNQMEDSDKEKLFKYSLLQRTITRIENITTGNENLQENDLETFLKNSFPFKSYLTVPVISRNGNILGHLLYGHNQASKFSHLTEQIISGIAAQAAIAIDNAILFLAAKETRDQLANINEELTWKNDELTKINNDLDSFVYTASHDLKAPVSNIEGLMITLSDVLTTIEGVNEEVQPLFEMINASINRFKNTILDLTEITKIQKNFNDDVSEVNIQEIIKDVMFSIENLINESKAEVQILIDSPISIKFSKVNFKSIVYNLISNAVKYKAEDRSPKITISARKENNKFFFSIRDNGLGISKENKKKLFSMFKRFHDHVEGTGVGLYIVKRIVDNNGGIIEIDSEEGKGTEFKIQLNVN